MKRNKGITLVALIMTIIIMLVLVSVSIAILFNEGIIGKADEAVEATQAAYEKEASEGKNYRVKGNTYNSIGEYLDSKKERKDIEDVIEDALDNREGKEEIGIGTDGKIVNLDYWLYYEYRSGEMALGIQNGSFNYTKGYIGDIVNGEIIGSVPQYIAPEGEDKFYPVTAMFGTFYNITDLVTAPELPTTLESITGAFYGCTGLRNAPEIPDGVKYIDSAFSYCSSLVVAPQLPSSATQAWLVFAECTSLTTVPAIPEGLESLESTFYKCTSLVTAPSLPQSVYNLNRTFYGCTSLRNAPAIPNNVTNMGSTFFNCTSLTTAPTIPSKVNHMTNTFNGCSSLTGDLAINVSSVYTSNIKDCFKDAATNSGCNLKLTGTSTQLNDFLNTASANSHISIK